MKIINKWKSLPASVKSSIAFACSSFLIKGISFLVTPIFTRIMPVEEYGKITTYNSWLSIIEILATIGLMSAGIINIGIKDYKEKSNELIASCMGLCNFCTILIFAIIGILQIFGITVIENDLLIVMFIHFLFSPAMIFWITKEKYAYRYKTATILSVLSVVLGQVISILGVLIFKDNAVFAKITGYEIGNIVFALPLFIYILINGKKYFNWKNWKYILILAIPLIPHYMSQHIMSSSDKIMLSELVGETDVAIYGVIANISIIGSVLWNAINGSLVPYTFEKIESGKGRDIKKISNEIIIIFAFICIALMLIAPEIMHILAPAEYYNGIYIIPPLVTTIFLQAVYNLYANVEFYFKKTKSISSATTIATLVNIALNFVFIPKYGYVAASYTTLASYTLLAGLHYINYRRCKENNIYNNKLIFASILLLDLMCPAISILYTIDNIARYGIIILIVIIAIVYRRKLINTFQKIKNNNNHGEKCEN